MGAPHLARFLRDVGYHGGTPVSFLVYLQKTLRFVVSHISQKTSEMWGTHGSVVGRNPKDSP
jgi:hypothetical protein